MANGFWDFNVGDVATHPGSNRTNRYVILDVKDKGTYWDPKEEIEVALSSDVLTSLGWYPARIFTLVTPNGSRRRKTKPPRYEKAREYAYA